MEKKKHSYIGGIAHGLKTLCVGLKVTFIEFFKSEHSFHLSCNYKMY